MATSTEPLTIGPLDEEPLDTEPLYTPEDKQEILDFTADALTSIDLTNTVDRPISRQLSWWLTNTFNSKLSKNLGSLSSLPLELVFAVCLELDIKSCITFRQVNRRARETVSNLVEYRAITTHALSVVQAVLWSGMGPHVKVADLYRLLCTHECMICSTPDSSDSFRFYDSRAPKNKPRIALGVKGLEAGRAALDKAIMSSTQHIAETGNKEDQKDSGQTTRATAPAKKPTALTVLSMAGTDAANNSTSETAAGLYLFLPTLTRCCKPCLEESPRLRIVPLVSLRSAADLPRRDFLPVLCTPWFKEKVRTRTANDKSDKNSIEHKIKTGIVTQDNAVQVLYDAGFTSARVQSVLYESGYLDEFCWWNEVAQRDKFTVMMPFFDRRTNTADGGYTCRGCDTAIKKMYGHLKVALDYTNTVFSTEAAFFGHFAACPEAIKLWKHERSKPQQ